MVCRWSSHLMLSVGASLIFFFGSPACWILSPLKNHGDLFGCFQLGPSQPWHQPCGTPGSLGPCTCIPCQDKWHDGHSMCDPPGHGRCDQTLQSASAAKGTATYQCPRWKNHPSGCPFGEMVVWRMLGATFCWNLIVNREPPPKKKNMYTKCMSWFHIFQRKTVCYYQKWQIPLPSPARWKLVIPGRGWWRTLRRNGKWIATKEILGGFGLLLLGHLVEICWKTLVGIMFFVGRIFWPPPILFPS